MLWIARLETTRSKVASGCGRARISPVSICMRLATPSRDALRRATCSCSFVERVWLLRRREADVRRADPQRLHSSFARSAIQTICSPGIGGLPVCQPSRGQDRTVGRRAEGRKDEGVPVAEAGACRSVRVRGMDAGWSPPACAFHGRTSPQLPCIIFCPRFVVFFYTPDIPASRYQARRPLMKIPAFDLPFWRRTRHKTGVVTDTTPAVHRERSEAGPIDPAICCGLRT
jgi:hypothetical protein